jgi:hypothetical protein
MHTDRPMNEPFVEEKTKQIDCDSGMDAEFRKGLEDLARWEAVDHPSHYNQGKIEAIDYIQAWNMDFVEGSVVKYITRYKFKGKPIEDLEKAKWYLERLIQRLEAENAS